MSNPQFSYGCTWASWWDRWARAGGICSRQMCSWRAQRIPHSSCPPWAARDSPRHSPGSWDPIDANSISFSARPSRNNWIYRSSWACAIWCCGDIYRPVWTASLDSDPVDRRLYKTFCTPDECSKCHASCCCYCGMFIYMIYRVYMCVYIKVNILLWWSHHLELFLILIDYRLLGRERVHLGITAAGRWANQYQISLSQ